MLPSRLIDDPEVALACRKLLRRIRVVRRFSRQPVEAAVLDDLLEVARWTGSAKNRQPWRFVVVRDPAMRANLADCGVRSFAAPLRDAPVAIVLVQRPEGYEFDMGRVAQAIIIAATTFGLGACPVTLYDEDRAHQLLSVPTDHRCRYSIALGYPDEGAEQELRQRLPKLLPRHGRLPVSELVHEGRFQALEDE